MVLLILNINETCLCLNMGLKIKRADYLAPVLNGPSIGGRQQSHLEFK